MVDEVVGYDLGVDVDQSWSMVDGDLKLVSYSDNLVQAISNRLNTGLNELDLFYTDYGSTFKGFLGWRGNDETTGFIKAELETVLKAEPRLANWSYEVNYLGNGTVRVDLRLVPVIGEIASVGLELNSNGVEVIE